MTAMPRDISDLLKKALALPCEARSALASFLLESLDETVAPSADEEEWSNEIARRVEELDSGKVKPIPWAEARHQTATDAFIENLRGSLAKRDMPTKLERDPDREFA